MSQIDKAFRVQDGISLRDEVLIYYTVSDPTSGDGYEAPVGSLLSEQPAIGDGKLWLKYGALDTEWKDISNEIDIEIFSDALKEPTGFENRQHSTMTFSVVSNEAVFSITPDTPTYTQYNIWITGTKYIIDETKSITLPDTEGLHVIYFDTDETLKSVLNPDYLEMLTVITEKAIVSLLYWDAENKIIVYDGEERHGSIMDGMTHYYLHFTQSMKWVEGLALGSFSIGDGSSDAHAQFSTENGLVTDEDLGLSIDTVGSTVGFPILYRAGANGYWRRLEQSGFACYRGANTRLSWNKWDTGISEWKLSEVDNNKFVLYHIFATTGYSNSMFSIMGQNTYGNVSEARVEASVEISKLLLGTLPSPETFAVATVIFQSGNYGNTVNARIILTSEGENYIDWRTSDLPRGSAPTDHGNLTGLLNDHHFQYLLTDGSRDITGIIDYDSDKDITDNNSLIHKKFMTDYIEKEGYIKDLSGFTANDYFLPSKDEAYKIYENRANISTYATYPDAIWTSSEYDKDDAWALALKDIPAFGLSAGDMINYGKVNVTNFIPVRKTTDIAGRYALGDETNVSTIVFHIVDNGDGTETFYQVAKDYTVNWAGAWSNITNTLIGTTETAIGTGTQNTLDIINQAGHTESLAQVCEDKEKDILVINNKAQDIYGQKTFKDNVAIDSSKHLGTYSAGALDSDRVNIRGITIPTMGNNAGETNGLRLTRFLSSSHYVMHMANYRLHLELEGAGTGSSLVVGTNGKIGINIGAVDPSEELDVGGNIKATGSVQIGNESVSASASNVGKMRYVSGSGYSRLEMAMQTDSETYEWVVIKENTW